MKKINVVLITVGLSLISSVSLAACKNRLKLNSLTNVKVFQCDDNTITYAQPANTEYEGLCGATAAANVFYAYCDNKIIDPVEVSKQHFWDITPGVRPDSLRSGLNRLFKNNSDCIKGKWRYYASKNRWDFMNSLYSEVRRGNGKEKRIISKGVEAVRSPVPVLTKSGKNLHWVTVVDIIGYTPYNGHTVDYKQPGCKIIYNDDSTQTAQSCADFIARANGIDDAWYTDVILPEYVHLVFEPIK